jgi:hypothetical protein
VPVISMIACFHLLLAVLRPSTHPVDVALVVFQACLIVFAIHLRTTAQWQVMTIAIVTLIVIAVRLYRSRRPALRDALRRHASASVPLLVLTLGMLGLRSTGASPTPWSISAAIRS